MRHGWDRDTVQGIASKAETAFWAALAEELPGVPGDVDPWEARHFSDACFRAVDEWTRNAETPIEKLAEVLDKGIEAATMGAPADPNVPGLNFRQRVGARLASEG